MEKVLDTYTKIISYKDIIWPLYPKLESCLSLGGVENFNL